VSTGDGNTSSPQLTSFEQILQEAYQQGGFEAVVLASSEGLPIAVVPLDYQADAVAAMVALLQQVGSQARRELGLGELDEVTVLDRTRTRLVCRHLVVGDEDLVLATAVRPGATYRRITTAAIRRIMDAFAATQPPAKG